MRGLPWNCSLSCSATCSPLSTTASTALSFTGYLSGLSRPEQVVHFFRQVVGVPVVSKELLSQRTADHQAGVEAFAPNHRLPIEWAEKGVRKEDHVVPWQRCMARKRAYGVYYIFKSMEQPRETRTRKQRSATAAAGTPILAESQTPTRPIAQSKTSAANGPPCSGMRPVQFGIAVSRKPTVAAANPKTIS